MLRITNRNISLESHWKGVTLQMAVVVGCHFVFKVKKSYKMPSFGNVHQMAGDVLFVLKKSENHLALMIRNGQDCYVMIRRGKD